MGIFYAGIRLLPTYNDGRMVRTLYKSIEVLKEYFAGFYVLAKKAFAEGINVKIFNMYYQKKSNKIIVDKPITFEELSKLNKTKEAIAEMFMLRANELGQLD